MGLASQGYGELEQLQRYSPETEQQMDKEMETGGGGVPVGVYSLGLTCWLFVRNDGWKLSYQWG